MYPLHILCIDKAAADRSTISYKQNGNIVLF